MEVCAEVDSLLTPEIVNVLFHSDSDVVDIRALICSNAKAYVTGADGEVRTQRETNLVRIGVSCLNYFVQNNWTGPPAQFDPSTLLSERLQPDLSTKVASSLEVNGEEIYELATYPLCLLIGTVLLSDLDATYTTRTMMRTWWSLRCCKIHQDLLLERSPDLKARCMQLIDQLSVCDELINHNDLHAEFMLEASHIFMFYYEYNRAAEMIQKARELVNIDVDLTGVMGKRTKFHDGDPTPQLVCRVTAKPGVDRSEPSQSDYVLPKDVPMNSDVLLERVAWDEDPDRPSVERITPIEAALIFSVCLHNKRLQASSPLCEEETLAYIEAITRYAVCWPVLSHALTIRSSFEKRRSKRFERSLQQLEELMNQFKHAQPPASRRTEMLYASHMNPIWMLQKELAHLYIAFGMTDTALEIFLKLRLWSEVIECYQHLGRLEKAESVIRERLKLGETPALYCYLGDVTSDPAHYERAWQLSNGRSSRAQKSWAIHLFYKGQFEDSISHFEKSLELNQLQAGLWFTYGCACMAVNSLDRAVHAFRRSVTLEYDNYQGWTNLSACLAKSNDKPKSFRVLEEAIRCNYENYRIWENYVVIGLDCGEFEKVIKGYHRLLDLRDKHADTEVLSILVKAVNEGLADATGRSAAALRTKLQQLLGRQTSQVTGNSVVWKLYAELISHVDSRVEEKAEKALLHYQKSQRCLTQTDDYLTDVTKAVDVVNQTSQIVQDSLSLVDSVTNKAQAIQILVSTKLSTTNLLTKVKKKHQTLTGELMADLVEPCTTLDNDLSKVIAKINEINA